MIKIINKLLIVSLVTTSVFATSFNTASAKIKSRISNTNFEGSQIKVKADKKIISASFEVAGDTVAAVVIAKGRDGNGKRKYTIEVPFVSVNTTAKLIIVSKDETEEFNTVILNDPNDTTPSEVGSETDENASQLANVQSNVETLNQTIENLQVAVNSMQALITNQTNIINNLPEQILDEVNTTVDPTIVDINGEFAADINVAGKSYIRVQDSFYPYIYNNEPVFPCDQTLIRELNSEGIDSPLICDETLSFAVQGDEAQFYNEHLDGQDYLNTLSGAFDGQRVVIKAAGKSAIFNTKIFAYSKSSFDNIQAVANTPGALIFKAQDSITEFDNVNAPKNTIVMDSSTIATIISGLIYGRYGSPFIGIGSANSLDNNKQVRAAKNNSIEVQNLSSESQTFVTTLPMCSTLNFELIYDGRNWHFVNESDFILNMLSSLLLCPSLYYGYND